MAGRLAMLLLIAAAILPATAHAGEVRKEGSILIYEVKPPTTTADGVRVMNDIGDRFEFYGYNADPTEHGSVAAACEPYPMPNPDSIRCPKAALGLVTQVILIGGPSGETLDTRFLTLPATVEGRGGDDRIVGGSQPEHFDGGAGYDRLEGGAGADTLLGAAGRDTLVGGAGPDVLSGGSQFDTADYSQRTEGVVVTIGAGADDGAAGEGDSVGADVEDVIGGTGADRLVGTSGANELTGGAGNDELVGGAGFDAFVGGPGADRLIAQDGGPDQVTCNEDLDSAIVDAVDALSECETVDVSNVLQPDRDADGLNAPIDCDDTRADVHPGAGDVPDNGVDEDCAGGDATDPDRDGDGYQRPEDCDDARRDVNPGAAETPGNGRDDDCDGSNPSFARNPARVGHEWAVFGDGTEATRLTVSGLLAPARVELRCRGGGCPSGRKRFKAGRSARPLDVRRALKGRRLAPGAVVTVRISKAGQLTKVVRYTIRARKTPAGATRCVAPGSKKERRC